MSLLTTLFEAYVLVFYRSNEYISVHHSHLGTEAIKLEIRTHNKRNKLLAGDFCAHIAPANL